MNEVLSAFTQHLKYCLEVLLRKIKLVYSHMGSNFGTANSRKYIQNSSGTVSRHCACSIQTDVQVEQTDNYPARGHT
jgi:hypothetical protein